MIRVPSKRWLVIAAGFAVIAPLAIWWPPAAGVLLAVDLLWIAALVADMASARSPKTIDVAREAPAAFSVGRVLPVRYRWRHGGPRPIRILVREQLPEPLGGAETPERVLLIPESREVEELLQGTTRRLLATAYEHLPDVVGVTGRLLVGALIFFVVLYMLLLRSRELMDLLVQISPLGERHTRRILVRLENTINGVFLGSLATALVQGTIGALGFWIVGFPNVLVLGALIADPDVDTLVGHEHGRVAGLHAGTR